jgi:translation elongation factor EF-Ts
VSVKGFVRFSLGEGVEKSAGPNFATEVAAMSGQS